MDARVRVLIVLPTIAFVYLLDEGRPNRSLVCIKSLVKEVMLRSEL